MYIIKTIQPITWHIKPLYAETGYIKTVYEFH